MLTRLHAESTPSAHKKKRPALPPAVRRLLGEKSSDYSRWCLPCMHLPAATVWLCPCTSVELRSLQPGVVPDVVA